MSNHHVNYLTGAKLQGSDKFTIPLVLVAIIIAPALWNWLPFLVGWLF